MKTVFLCSPVYREMMPETVLSMLKASMALEAVGYKVTLPDFVTECPYVHYSRAELVSRGLHARCDMTLTFDSDMEFSADTVVAMCEAIDGGRAEIVGGAYVLRWGSRFAVEYLPGDLEEKRFRGFHLGDHRFIEVAAVGTGLLAYSRKAILRMIEACPEVMKGPKVEPKIMVFDHTYRDTGEGIVMPRGEDYTFCDYAIKSGLKVHCCTTAKTKHFARFGFTGDMDKQLVEGGAAFEESGAV